MISTTPTRRADPNRRDLADGRLGFAALWELDRAPTWSWIPWNLRRALARRTEVVDLGVRVPALPRMGLKATYARRRQGEWVTVWKHAALPQRAMQRALLSRARRMDCDAVVQAGDLAVFDRPFFVLQDLSFDVLLRAHEADERGALQFPGLDHDALLRLRDRQHRVYERAAGVLAMSRWFADTLTRWSGVPAERVHVVPPGATSVSPRPPDPSRLERQRRRLLFIGRDFERKGGDLVVAAFAALAADDPSLRLTVAGPSTWPLPGEPAPGVTFLGPVTPAQAAALYDEHDLFVMPSRFEAFGIVFVEALSRGVPCIGRDAYAMPEIIHAGVNGDLVRGDDPDELARAIRRALDDDGLAARCWERRGSIARTFTWERAADDVVRAVDATLSNEGEST